MEFFQCNEISQTRALIFGEAHLFVFPSSQFKTKIISNHGTQNHMLYMSSTCVSRALLQVQITQLLHPTAETVQKWIQKFT